MAETVTSRKIKFQFTIAPSESSSSTKRTWTFSDFTTETETLETDLQAFVTAMITNGSIFDTPPLSIIKAEIEETTVEQILPSE